jgi:hypothetical protein
MKKITFYFPHDYHARNDMKLVKLRMKQGHAGIGIYWQLIEMLYENGGTMQTQYDCIADALRTDSDCITDIITNYDLFTIEGEIFYSQSVIKRIGIMEQKSEQAKQASESRWNKERNRNVNPNALQTQSVSNPIKQNKTKQNEIKQKLHQYSSIGGAV